MNFTLKLALSEIVKNKSKVLIAIIVTLILFMSAFTLCNIATALPSNFYNYYEEYMHDTIGMHISNADKDLYDNKDKYFITFEEELDVACKNYSLLFNGKEQLPYDEIKDIDGTILATNYYNNILLSEKDHLPEIYSQFFEGESSGKIWDFDEEGIWLSNKFVGKDKLDIAVGDKLQYKYGNTIIELVVKGIFDGEKLRDYIVSQSGSNMVNDYLCFVSEPSARKILFESNTTFNAYGVVGKIDKLYEVYNDLHKKYSIKEVTAFDMISTVKNTQVICMIVGIIMIICGIIIMLNFINMIISQNIKHISLLRILGTDTFRIMMAYFIIFMLLITIVCVISWMTLPLYNYFVSLYCASIGYSFTIGINYWVVLGVFAICYFITCMLMLAKWLIMQKTAPSRNILEED